MWRNETLFKEYDHNEQHNGFYVLVKLSQDPCKDQIHQGMDAYMKYIDKMQEYFLNQSVTSFDDSNSDTTLNQPQLRKKIEKHKKVRNQQL